MSKTTNRRPLIVGGVFLVVAIVVGILYFGTSSKSDHHQPTTTTAATPLTKVNCLGAEKTALLADPAIKQLLRTKYHLSVTWTRRGSYEVAQIPTADLKSQRADCIWPSSASAQSVFKAAHKTSDFTGYREESVLESPEVLYAGADATDVMVKAGIVKRQNGSFYIVNIKTLMLDYVLQHRRWESIGAANMGGPIKITSTDPRTSNSSFTMYQLILTTLASGDPFQPPTTANVESTHSLPIMQAILASQGLQTDNSDGGFNDWILQGTQSLYAGYENQLVQKVAAYKAKGNNGAVQLLKNGVRILYPDPTLFNTHPLIALSPAGGKFIDAMKDPEIQRIAWESYGFRGIDITGTNFGRFPNLGLSTKLRATAPPGADVTMLLLNCLTDEHKCS